MRTFCLVAIVVSANILLSCARISDNDYNGGFTHLTAPVYGVVQAEVETMYRPGNGVMPQRLFISRNTLVMFNDNGTSFYDIYTLPHLHYVNSLGRRDHKEGLHITPYAGSIKPTEDGLAIFDNGTVKYINLRFGELEVDKEIYIKGMTKNFFGFTMLDDSLYVVMPDPELFKTGVGVSEEKGELAIVNNSDGSMVEVGEYPRVMRQHGIEIGGKCFAVNEKLRRFACFYSLQKQLKIIDFEGNELHRVAVDIPPYLNYENMSFSNKWGGHVYYVDCCAHGDYIYALCLNQERDSYVSDVSDENSEIHIFDWNGQLLKVVECDRPVSCFAVSEEYGTIYASSATVPDNILRLPLPDITATGDSLYNADTYMDLRLDSIRRKKESLKGRL